MLISLIRRFYKQPCDKQALGAEMHTAVVPFACSERNLNTHLGAITVALVEESRFLHAGLEGIV